MNVEKSEKKQSQHVQYSENYDSNSEREDSEHDNMDDDLMGTFF